MGPSRALDLLWTARRFDTEEAYRIGFVDRVVPTGEVVDAACRYIDDLAANVSARSTAIMTDRLAFDWPSPHGRIAAAVKGR